MTSGPLFHRVTQIALAIRFRIPPRIPFELFPNPLVFNLFQILPAHDQRHLLAVYQACVAEDLPESVLRGALLHDIGKVRLSGSAMSIVGRTWHVLFGRFCPAAERWLVGQRLPVISNELFLAMHHAEIGADRLAALGEPDEVCAVVRNHDAPPAREPGMIRFQEIDSATP